MRDLLLVMGALVPLVWSPAVSGESEAIALLRARNAEFDREIIQVTDGVYTAIGYGASTISMVLGHDGVVVIDGGMSVSWSREAREAFEEITDLPIKALVLTHDHGDHTLGARAFVDADREIEVWATEAFGKETRAFQSAGITYNRVRGARQGGFRLPPDKRINNGIAPALYPSGEVFNPSDAVRPNRQFSSEREIIQVAGLTLHLVANPGETADQLYVWLPDKKVIFAGDNFYKSWPNLYAIRGTPYRDVKSWVAAVDRLLEEDPHFLVGGHTRPILGHEQVKATLTHYRDAIRYVFDKTIEGINGGLTPDELVAYARLPDDLAANDYLMPYYGHPEWAVRSIFSGYLGWFDGNPTNLFPLSAKERAKRMVQLVGADKLLQAASVAFAQNDPQWAAELTDLLLALNPRDKQALLLKAQSLERLAENLLTATGRNYYLTVAQELRAQAEKQE